MKNPYRFFFVVGGDKNENSLMKPDGGQKQTWPKLIEKDLKVFDMNLDSAAIHAQSKPQRQSMTNRIMSELSDGRYE